MVWHCFSELQVAVTYQELLQYIRNARKDSISIQYLIDKNVSMFTYWPIHFTHCKAGSSHYNYLNSSWHGFDVVLETFLIDQGPCWLVNITYTFCRQLHSWRKPPVPPQPLVLCVIAIWWLWKENSELLIMFRNQFDLIWALWHGVILHEEVIRGWVRRGCKEMDMARDPQVGWGAKTLKWY